MTSRTVQEKNIQVSLKRITAVYERSNTSLCFHTIMESSDDCPDAFEHVQMNSDDVDILP